MMHAAWFHRPHHNPARHLLEMSKHTTRGFPNGKPFRLAYSRLLQRHWRYSARVDSSSPTRQGTRRHQLCKADSDRGDDREPPKTNAGEREPQTGFPDLTGLGPLWGNPGARGVNRPGRALVRRAGYSGCSL